MKDLLLYALVTTLGTGPLGMREDAPTTVESIQARHDQALVAELGAYLKEWPDAEDRDRAYLKIFETAIDHDWFAEHEGLAAEYLVAEPRGAVAPMARIVAIMARAQADDFEAASEGFRAFMKTLDEERPIAFAADFARTLAGEAVAAGRVEVARRVYGDLLERFGADPDLRADVARWQGRLDLVDRPAPEFRVRDLEGESIVLTGFRGRYVLLDFWATWCEPCLVDRPALGKAYDTYRGADLEVISISLDDTEDAARRMVRARGWPWRQVHAATAGVDLVELYRVEQLPSSVLIDPEGRVVRLDLKGEALKTFLDREIERRTRSER